MTKEYYTDLLPGYELAEVIDQLKSNYKSYIEDILEEEGKANVKYMSEDSKKYLIGRRDATIDAVSSITRLIEMYGFNMAVTWDIAKEFDNYGKL